MTEILSEILYVISWVIYAPVFGFSWAYDTIQEFHTYRGKDRGTAILAVFVFYACALFAIPSMFLICVFGLNIAEHTRIQGRY